MSEYIDREAAIKEIENADYSLIADDAESLKADYLGEIIENIPAADVAPVVRGRWRQMGDTVFECSQCGSGWLFKDGTPEEMGAKFCSYCGAKMDGKDTSVPTTMDKEDGNDGD